MVGRFNEDVFDCRKCGQTIVYEPANEEIVKCDHCGTNHKINDDRTIEKVYVIMFESEIFESDFYTDPNKAIERLEKLRALLNTDKYWCKILQKA